MILDKPRYDHYDVIILGSGPAGISTALELSKASALKIAIIESGLIERLPAVQDLAKVQLLGDLSDRYFPMHTQRCFGGSSTIWGGFCTVLERRPFTTKTWPIPYEEIDRWYPTAAGILELPDKAHREPVVAIEGTSDVVYKPFYLSPPVRFSLKYHAWLAQHPKVDLILGATGTRLIKQGHTITAVELRDSLIPQFSPTSLSADRFVLACGGVGNPRVLQLSNIVGPMPVGRGLMEHPHLYAVADVYLDSDRILSVIENEEKVVHALQLSDHYCVEHGVLSFSADFNLEKIEPAVILGKRQKMLHSPVSIRAEIAPDPRNFVGPGDSATALGFPVTKVDFHYYYRELALESWRRFGEALLRPGLGRASTLKPDFQIHSGGHLMGTTRMGLTAEDSVVDRNCRVHTTNNLYVAGSSVFPAGGAAHPTYNLVALALRLGDHLANTAAGDPNG